MKTVSEYEQKAIDFLTKHNIEFKAIYIRAGSMRWDKRDPKTGKQDTRDIYTIVFSRWTGGIPELNKQIQFTIHEFGQSIASSGIRNPLKKKTAKNPSAYDVLACITKSDPDSFEEFCSCFEYDEDSRNAFATWEAVTNEWKEVRTFFTDAEIEELQEIN